MHNFLITYISARPVTGLILMKQLTVQGFIVGRWLPQWPDAFKEMTQWIVEVYCILIYPPVVT